MKMRNKRTNRLRPKRLRVPRLRLPARRASARRGVAPVKPITLLDPEPLKAATDADAMRPVADGVRGDALQLYLREIGQVQLLTPQEEIVLARKIKRGDKRAREHMIKANLRLVVKIARDYDGLGLPLLDLINEGNIGLMKGVERFNPAKGAKLSTYASWWIKQSIKRALANQSKTIRLPVHVVDKVSHLRRMELKLRETLDRDPTDEELAHELGMTARRVGLYRQASRAPVSLDAPVGDDESSRISEIVADPTAVTPFERIVQETDTALVREVLAALTERESTIVAMRFGLNDTEPKTLEQVGEHFGVTRERIRQIQDEALRKLRVMMEKRDRPLAQDPITLAVAA
jgi:RNA polymerase primary sigma factor